MANAAFKYVPQTAATTFALSFIWFFFYAETVSQKNIQFCTHKKQFRKKTYSFAHIKKQFRKKKRCLNGCCYVKFVYEIKIKHL